MKNGLWRFGALALLSVSLVSCALIRKEPPPRFDYVCTLDGFGGGDCATGDGERVYKKPSEMRNDWCTNQDSIYRFAAWAYGVTPDQVDDELNRIKNPQPSPEPEPTPDYGSGG